MSFIILRSSWQEAARSLVLCQQAARCTLLYTCLESTSHGQGCMQYCKVSQNTLLLKQSNQSEISKNHKSSQGHKKEFFYALLQISFCWKNRNTETTTQTLLVQKHQGQQERFLQPQQQQKEDWGERGPAAQCGWWPSDGVHGKG